MAASSTQRRPARSRISSRAADRRRRVRLRRAIALGAAALGGLALAFFLFRGSVDKVIEELTLPLRHEDIIRQQAAEKEVDASLIAAVIYSESRFRDQVSPAGARGLMQITPATARDIERRSGGTTFTVNDLSDPQINIAYGTFHLRDLLDRYAGNEVAVLAAYNAGPSMADAWGGSEMSVDDIGYPETRAYVDDVLDKREAYRRKYAKELGY